MDTKTGEDALISVTAGAWSASQKWCAEYTLERRPPFVLSRLVWPCKVPPSFIIQAKVVCLVVCLCAGHSAVDKPNPAPDYVLYHI